MGLFTGNGLRGHMDDPHPSHNDTHNPEGTTESTEQVEEVNTPNEHDNPSQEPVGSKENTPPPMWMKIVGNLSTAALGTGFILGGFLFYQTTYSDWINQMEQERLLESLGAQEWEGETVVVNDPEPENLEITEGQPWATISIPSIDSTHAIVGGVRKEDLNKGPGFFMDSAHPGQPGNFSLAGHRIGKGAPFNRLDELTACDTITIETEQRIHTYQVLPNNDDTVDCLTGEDRKQWESLGKPKGSNIVMPTDVGVVAPNPFVQSQDEEEITDQDNMKLLTLVTCNPEWGNWERLIIHATHTQTEVKK